MTSAQDRSTEKTRRSPGEERPFEWPSVAAAPSRLATKLTRTDTPVVGAGQA
jgi:hypothetical protein